MSLDVFIKCKKKYKVADFHVNVISVTDEDETS